MTTTDKPADPVDDALRAVYEEIDALRGKGPEYHCGGSAGAWDSALNRALWIIADAAGRRRRRRE
jgi:hypothetical protein